MRLWRFSFAMVLAMHAWSSVLLASCPAPGQPADGGCLFPSNRSLSVPQSLSDSFTISGRPKFRDDDAELTATKGDIDALNKRLDHIEDLIRCLGPEVHAADDGITQPQKECP
jgi:hypothetical protein